MKPFDYVKPRQLAEAVSLLSADDPDTRPVSGGTAIMLMMKAGVLRPARLVSLRHVEDEFRQIAVAADGSLHIGGMTTLAELERSPEIQQGWPMLARTFKTLSNIRVRNVAMIGGNLAHGDPHMDMPPVLTALGATVVIQGPNGSRELPVKDLCLGYYETALAGNELITKVIVPPMQGRQAAYFKVTTRVSHDWPTLGLAAVVKMEQDRLADARLIVGAATDRPTSLDNAVQLLVGQPLSDALLKQAGEEAAHGLDIVSDQHGSAQYKKHLLSVYLGRAVRAAVGGGQQEAS
ncbi:xanthine dehydrogenase family protein subunit M [Neopusillimonas maritima]|jgi:carbon-monoxide dehydrogenase medium subunit|uniref:Molybdopterin dehydrogenase n=1 Tax=Neopusillimonas maritima TaxID=2026239 RepID=A0ABX9MU96_9BURK|nr:xanthine dehydrogenase family protein subunit M [Neopusillimonas maritima]RII82529.1 molybdopterin dehydrogenase [Neopusillimonas maritima]